MKAPFNFKRRFEHLGISGYAVLLISAFLCLTHDACTAHSAFSSVFFLASLTFRANRPSIGRVLLCYMRRMIVLVAHATKVSITVSLVSFASHCIKGTAVQVICIVGSCLVRKWMRTNMFCTVFIINQCPASVSYKLVAFVASIIDSTVYIEGTVLCNAMCPIDQCNITVTRLPESY